MSIRGNKMGDSRNISRQQTGISLKESPAHNRGRRTSRPRDFHPQDDAPERSLPAQGLTEGTRGQLCKNRCTRELPLTRPSVLPSLTDFFGGVRRLRRSLKSPAKTCAINSFAGRAARYSFSPLTRQAAWPRTASIRRRARSRNCCGRPTSTATVWRS